jgi:hypothetical protein
MLPLPTGAGNEAGERYGEPDCENGVKEHFLT